MRRTRTSYWLLAGIALMLWSAAPVRAQQCDDGNECTANDMCSDGTCSGSFRDGGCDDGDACTMNDHCEMDADGNVICLGDQPAPAGTACGGGCGTCQPIAPFPGAPVLCTGNTADNGKACDLGIPNPCIEGMCQITAIGGINSAFCFPMVKVCPDTDGNPCTDFCDFQTGQCRADISMCVPDCETCNPSSGVCEPINEGGACDDSDVCTPESHCHATDLGGGVVRGLCTGGAPTVPTPTLTPSNGGPTPTNTSGATPTAGACIGDCNHDGQVAINELVIGVNIALGSFPLSQCPAFDTNHSGSVEINELVGGVNSALNGCAA